MKIMFVNFNRKKKNKDVMMKHLRENNNIIDKRNESLFDFDKAKIEKIDNGIFNRENNEIEKIFKIDSKNSKNEIKDKKESNNNLYKEKTKQNWNNEINKENKLMNPIINEEGVNTFLEKLHEAGKKVPARKNQIAMFAISLMLITAGYFNYANNVKLAELGDAELVASQDVTTEQNEVENENKVDEENQNEIVSKNIDNKKEKNDYFTETRLQRNKMYSEMIETYTKILESEKIPETQKAIATNEIKNINDKNAKIKTIENLLKTKQFEDGIVMINENNVEVIIKSKENLKTEQVAQIQNIVSRELNTEIGNIHITTHE